MSSFVTLAELKTYLGDAPASSDDALLQKLLDNVEALFASETGRTGFTAAGDRVEVLDGTGTSELYLDFPIAENGLTSIKLGYNSTTPDETLAVNDRTVLVYGEGSRVIRRVDGGRFGTGGQARYVAVEYEHQGDVPDNVALAIKSVAAMAYRRRGAEDVKSETVGSFYSRTMFDRVASEDPFWQMAVASNRRVAIV